MKTKKYKCERCYKSYTTAAGLKRHGYSHPAPAPRPPVTTPPDPIWKRDEKMSLKNARHMQPGMVYYRIQKCKIKEIVFTEKDRDAECVVDIVNSHWQQNEPI